MQQVIISFSLTFINLGLSVLEREMTGGDGGGGEGCGGADGGGGDWHGRNYRSRLDLGEN